MNQIVVAASRPGDAIASRMDAITNRKSPSLSGSVTTLPDLISRNRRDTIGGGWTVRRPIEALVFASWEMSFVMGVF